MSKIIEMLRLHEGEVKTNGRHFVYKCSKNFWTLGIGRNVDQNGGLGLSDDEVEFMLANDVRRVVGELEKAFPWFAGLDQVRKDAMTDLCFNVGITRLKGFVKALAAMAVGDYELAAYEFSDSNWYRQVASRGETIVDMIRYGNYPYHI